MKKALAVFFILFSLILIPQSALADDGWTQQPSADYRQWSSVSSSSDGTKLAAVVSGGYIYTSTDSGNNWTQRTTAGSRSWTSIASSSDGTKLAAVVFNGGYIYTSTDSGATWTEQTDSGSRSWTSITSSSDGAKLAATALGGYIYTSTDSGVTWTEQTGSGVFNWADIVSSSDGAKLAATSAGYIYTSTDSGVTWTEQTGSDYYSWGAIASSSDGAKLAASRYGGYIHTSTDSGVTWTEQTAPGALNWTDIASSSDGTKLIGTTESSYIYTSTDSGVTWTAELAAGADNWKAVAASSDWTKFIAARTSGFLSTYGILLEPEVETDTASSIHENYATLNAELVSRGSGVVTQRGFEYGLTTGYGTTKTYNGSFSEGSFSFLLSLLSCNTTYHFRVYATNATSTAYGEDESFTTSACSNSNPSSILYGVDGSGSNSDSPHLFKLDPENGTKIADIGEVGFNVTGLAVHPLTSVMYGSTGNSGSNTRSLITVDRQTGAGTMLGQIKQGNNSYVMGDIAFNATGVLYGWASNSGDLFTIDINSCDGVTCNTTRVGDCPFNCGASGSGLVFGDDDTLYAFSQGDSDNFLVMSTITGLPISEIPFTNPSGQNYSIASADLSEDGVIYGSRLNFGEEPADLITIDPDTATITSLGANTDMIFMDAIAFFINPVSEPTLTVSAPTSISREGATLSGEITDDGGESAIERGFEYGLTTSYGETVSSSGTFDEGVFSLDISGLECNTLYHVRSYAENSAGTGNSSDLTFTTSGCSSSSSSGSVPRYTQTPIVPVYPPTVPVPPYFYFTKNLSQGMKNTDVKELQKYLNTHGFIVSQFGPGSPGNETEYFGLKTKAAVVRFQSAHAIKPSVGFFGPLTRAFVNKTLNVAN